MTVTNAPHPVVCARLEGVQFGYRRGVRVVDGLDLEIPGGRTVLLGPNGAGKTTLLGLLTGLLVPRRGRVCLTGGQSARGRWLAATWGTCLSRCPTSGASPSLSRLLSPVG